MFRLLAALLLAVRSALRSRRDFVLENVALRQQFATLLAKRRPTIRPSDRAFWVLLRRVRPENAEAIVFSRVSRRATPANDLQWLLPRWGSLRPS